MAWRSQDRSKGSFEGKVLFQECTHLVGRNKVQLSYAVRVPSELLKKLQLAEYSRVMTHPWMPAQGRYICLHNMRCRIAVRVHALSRIYLGKIAGAKRVDCGLVLCYFLTCSDCSSYTCSKSY